ncbi:DUF5652 family protein [Glaciibacter sp. 2TAF33]|uniref:DUF5652 family protein n=1 Tax=Glaciibacter sp. 2TAF33 TaxID=3233015 RepID=UPI003F90E1F7
MKQHHGAKAAAPTHVRGLIVALVAWNLAWKGASLWRAVKDDRKPWFVTLLISNTLGILDAIYLFGVSGARRRMERDEEAILAATGEPAQLGHSQET